MGVAVQMALPLAGPGEWSGPQPSWVAAPVARRRPSPTPARVATPGPRGRTVQPHERTAIRRLLQDRGFEHAIPTIADVVATTVEPGASTEAEERLDEIAASVQAIVVDALVLVARRHGWRAS